MKGLVEPETGNRKMGKGRERDGIGGIEVREKKWRREERGREGEKLYIPEMHGR